jgi:hypothetical protein
MSVPGYWIDVIRGMIDVEFKPVGQNCLRSSLADDRGMDVIFSARGIDPQNPEEIFPAEIQLWKLETDKTRKVFAEKAVDTLSDLLGVLPSYLHYLEDVGVARAKWGNE